jgi:hypothetical protein
MLSFKICPYIVISVWELTTALKNDEWIEYFPAVAPFRAQAYQGRHTM